MVQRQENPRHEYYPVQRQYGWCQRAGKEAESPSEGSLTVGGAGRGDGKVAT